jgi:hypothetical protein
MSEVAELVKNRISTAVQVETNRAWMNPILRVILLIAPALLALEAVPRFAGKIVSENVFSLMLLALGIFQLTYGSASRMDPMLRRQVVVSGVVMMVCGAGLLILNLLFR